MNKPTKKYYKNIRRFFPLLGKEEKKFLSYLKTSLEEYQLNHPEYQYDDYVHHYGSPEDIVSAYYEHIESEYIVRHMKSRSLIKYTGICFIVIVMFVAIYYMYISHIAYQEYLDSCIYYEETIIEEE